MYKIKNKGYNSEEDVYHLYRWRVPYLLTGGEHISPASLKRQEEVLPAAELKQRRYNLKVPLVSQGIPRIFITGRNL